MASNDKMKRTGIRLIAAVTLILAVAACTHGSDGGHETAGGPAPGGAAGPAPAPADPTGGPGTNAPPPDAPPGAEHHPGPAPAAEPAPDPCDRPAEARWLLREARSAPHPDHDRVVFELCGGRERDIYAHYVDQRLLERPSGEASLAGNALLVLGIDGTALDNDLHASEPSQIRRYPRRWSPGHPLVKEIAMYRDHSGAVTVLLGLARPAAVTASWLADPPRVVIDLWYEPPARPLWPFQTMEQAREVQRAFDEGHQPWVGSPEQVIISYLRAEQGWEDATLRRLTDNLYDARASHGGEALVAVTQPVRTGPGGIWAVTWFRPPHVMN